MVADISLPSQQGFDHRVAMVVILWREAPDPSASPPTQVLGEVPGNTLKEVLHDRSMSDVLRSTDHELIS